MVSFLLFSLFLLNAHSSDVFELNDSNFEFETQCSTGATTGKWFVKFYAPWCGHCKSLVPTWEKLATELKGTMSVSKVDVTQNRAVGNRFDVKGFPTLILLDGGKYSTYKGKRDLGSLKEFALKGVVDGKACPKPPGIFDKLLAGLEGYATQLEAVVRKYPNVLGSVIVFSLVFGFVFGYAIGFNLAPVRVIERPKKNN